MSLAVLLEGVSLRVMNFLNLAAFDAWPVMLLVAAGKLERPPLRPGDRWFIVPRGTAGVPGKALWEKVRRRPTPGICVLRHHRLVKAKVEEPSFRLVVVGHTNDLAGLGGIFVSFKKLADLLLLVLQSGGQDENSGKHHANTRDEPNYLLWSKGFKLTKVHSSAKDGKEHPEHL
eukprot:CAMPEP_0194602132 /NCGR_PEP_ID=MMETSP0292-20121207/29470_1 /TAXON_ID=39354 /ORGANISM="Heterosigma akashiwo, Strain CCMP2393" /LENGTH=173 /DNA_ID=CAMNT_0039464321 /DNA_START=297 /DNA_END=815 /DNA_ORIENTATION=-